MAARGRNSRGRLTRSTTFAGRVADVTGTNRFSTGAATRLTNNMRTQFLNATNSVNRRGSRAYISGGNVTVARTRNGRRANTTYTYGNRFAKMSGGSRLNLPTFTARRRRVLA